ncbi:MAG TPA: ATP phosphoribosyltransferase [Gemmatimonadaceae bacterium]|nr:ATP phosphoribosyltransferase [Gemmatimonadaceae bacterium]
MLRIALPNKGRLSEDARDLFNQAGLDVLVRGDRALTASLGGEFEAIFVRAQDVPEFVADGAADAGITGLDLVSESGRELESLLDLEFGKCRLVVACRDESPVTSVADIKADSRVATAFPSIARSYFSSTGANLQIVPISGAAEIAPHLGIADVILDVTSTGSTLRTNGLREIATVMSSSAQLYAARCRATTWSSEKLNALEQLTGALASVIRARGKRYLMANVPRESLPNVKEILPGISGPTVVDILNGGRFVAVHSVVQARTVYRTIASLKELGAEGILVTRIERLVP